jgi:hypothetical protein
MERADFSSPEAIRHYSDDEYASEDRTSETKRFNQQELNDLNRDLSVTKDKAELLASRLKEKYLLESYARVCHYRIRNNILKISFRVEGPMVFYHDFNGLFKADSHIAFRAHAAPLPCLALIHTCHAAPCPAPTVLCPS